MPPLSLASIADSRQEQIDEAIKKASSASSDALKLQILQQAIAEVRDGLSGVVIEQFKDTLSIDNLDEINAALRNELGRISRPILKAIDKLGVDRKKLEEAKVQIRELNGQALDRNFDISLKVTPKPSKQVEVSNFTDLAFPDTTKISNLSELKQYFDALSATVKSALNVEVKPPQVNVSPPQVNVPDVVIPEIRIPEINIPDNRPDLKPLLDGIKTLKDTIRRTSANQSKQMMAFSSGLNEASARKAFKQALQAEGVANVAISGGTAGGKALTDNTAGVALEADTAASYVDISTYGGLLAIGDSTSVRVDASAAGVVLTPGSAVYRVKCTNLNQVFVSGATGTRACYIYYV